MRSERVEEYLEAIFKRQKTEMLVSTSSIASDLGVSLPAVTDMIRRLEAGGLIKHEPNKGVLLTVEGKRAALSTIRRHRLWERFLTDILGLKWDKVHDEACRLEHAISPETEKRLATLLGDAETCPHGNPIPDEDGNIPDRGMRPLLEFDKGASVTICAITKEETKFLRKMDKLGLKPKSVVKIQNKNQDGSMELNKDGRPVLLDKSTVDCLTATPFFTIEEAGEEEIPVNKLSTGESGIFKKYSGDKTMLGRCLSLGFTPGSTIRIVRNFKRGPILVKIRDVEVALDREMASGIIVTRNRPLCQ